MVVLFTIVAGARCAGVCRRGLVWASFLILVCGFSPTAATARANREAFVWRRAASLAFTQSHANREPYGSGVLYEAMRYLGAGNVSGTQGAWCADYASMVLRRTGHRPLANRSASSALAYGPRVSQPRPGDLVVVSTRAGYAGHVGFFAGWESGQVVVVSGNWGRRVARALIAPGAVVAFIRI